MQGQAPERRYEAATSAFCLASLLGPALKGDRTPVRDDDDLSPLAHAAEAYSLGFRTRSLLSSDVGDQLVLGATGVVPEQVVEEHEPVAEKARGEELVPHVFLSE